jgi:hypothetical protein
VSDKPGNDPIVPHFHPTRTGGGFGAVEHGPHVGYPDRQHVHEGAGWGPSQPEAPLPPGAAELPQQPRRLRRQAYLDGRAGRRPS